MEFFFPEDGFTRTPPEETRIISLKAEPYQDNRRVHIKLEMSPFEKRPHLELVLSDNLGKELSSTSFIETMTWTLDFTMHIREEPNAGPLTLEARLFYPDGPAAPPFSVQFEPGQE